MQTVLICLLIAMLLPYIAKVPVAKAMVALGGYDNQHPREQQARLQGFGARALAAHQNAFESLLIFGIACIVTMVSESVNQTTSMLAITHVAARVLYHVLYLMDKSNARSLTWFVSTGASLAIFCQAF
ncbi:MAPEG family protein [Shewanella maritima]|uniref:MAPEG family protein n=1 Tax=Shewanella maritima TaxID=2520507 RepID=UPI0037356801